MNYNLRNTWPKPHTYNQLASLSPDVKNKPSWHKGALCQADQILSTTSEDSN